VPFASANFPLIFSSSRRFPGRGGGEVGERTLSSERERYTDRDKIERVRKKAGKENEGLFVFLGKLRFRGDS
jgi:hypothetical protein